MRKVITQTPRDLFNPPPQARFFSNDLDAMRDRAFYQWTTEYSERDALVRDIVGILEDHEDRLGRPS
jgi:hypothetical protein